jgi:hypothetical protein
VTPPLVDVPPLVELGPPLVEPDVVPESVSVIPGDSSLPQPENAKTFAIAAAARIEMTLQGSFLIASPPASASVVSHGPSSTTAQAP